jgi:ribonucleoside-triphosphate reductase (thioredoxin)
MSVKELQEYTRISKYARFNAEKGRRETWVEQINRVMGMHREFLGDKYSAIEEEFKKAEVSLKGKKVLGSQRALQFGGPAILRKNERLYNCTASYCDRPRFFQEAMYLLLCGAGVGFSVQKHHVVKLPKIISPDPTKEAVFEIPDSVEGWADAIGVLMSSYFSKGQSFDQARGKTIRFDYSKIRPDGATISDTNGKAPGPEPLKKAIKNIRGILDSLLESGKKKLTPLDAYDIIMHASDAVLSGGVRRSATICLFSHDDKDMMSAKTGNWLVENPQRGRSNNSAVLLRDELTTDEFAELFKSVKEYGEPGFIFVDHLDMLVNPCAEIGLWAYDEDGNSGWSFCNLSEINAMKARSEEEFYDACEAASILGTIQAAYTNFPYLGVVTERIVRREALIGVSITGIQDNPDIALDPRLLKKGARIVKATNKALSKKLGINQAARTTTVKPSGSASAVLGTSSGIHPQHAKRYIRRVQSNKNEEPLQFFELYNPKAVEEGVWSANNTDKVISFLCEVPNKARTKNDVGALQLLDDVKTVKINWVDEGANPELSMHKLLSHNVSNTINVKPDEWGSVEKYIYKNRRHFTGISLLSTSGDKDYAQAPFQAVYTGRELNEMYGNAGFFAAGVIVRAKRAFGSLYTACDAVLGLGEKIDDRISMDTYSGIDIEEARVLIDTQAEKFRWLEKAKKFANKYFEGDVRNMTYCLKDVDALKTWDDLEKVYVDVPWEKLVELNDNTKASETIACSGGACEITRF